MTDYNSIWIKWLTFLNMDFSFRKKFLEALNIEVTQGFDVITRIATEQIEAKIGDRKVFNEMKDDTETTIAFAVFAGYSLFLIQEGIDPEKENLIAKNATNELGNKWMENYDSDNNQSLLEKIDPILSMFMEKQTQIQLNKIFLGYPELQKLPYVQVAPLETFLNWAAHQGFIFGIIEKDLNDDKHKNP